MPAVDIATFAMCAQFSDDDVGKRVVNSHGDEVGMVSTVEHGTAYVEPDPGLTDTIKAKLGWQGRDEDAYPLQEAAVGQVTDDEIHLTGDLDAVGESTGTTGRTDSDRGGGDMVPTEGTDTGPRDSPGRETGIGDDTDTDDDNLLGDDDTTRR